jgi:phage shock protein PspC (stress-responsive transcriptional regulator)
MTETPTTEPPSGPPRPNTGLDSLWAAVRRPGIVRSTSDRWVGGVCAGVADRVCVDPVVVRVGVVVLTLLGGVGALVYGAAWLLLPDAEDRVEAQQVVAGDVSGSAVAAIALVVTSFFVPDPFAWWRGGPIVDGGDLLGLLVVVAVGLGALVWWPRRGTAWVRDRAPRPVPGPALTAATAGLALLAAGGAWLAGESGRLAGDPRVLAGAAATGVLAVAVLALGLAGRRDGTVGFLGVLAALATVAVAVVPSWSTVQAGGDARWRPTTIVAAERGWTLGVGSAELDLGRLDALAEPGDPVEVPVRVGLGTLTVQVPPGVDVEVRGQVLVGDVDTSRMPADGTPTGGRTVVVDARTLVGQVVVVPAGRS